MLKEKAQEQFDALFEKFVPAMGKAETLAGEILRAVSKIGYRYYNDGDIAWHDYGRETVNPALRFLKHVCESEFLTEAFEVIVHLLFEEDWTTEEGYEYLIDSLAEETIGIIDLYKLGERKNEYGDMLDYANPKEDVDRDDEEDEDSWYEDESEYDYTRD